MRTGLIALSLISATQAATVHVYFAGGQSNATNSWASTIETTLQSSAGATQVEVVHNPHSGSSMWQWTSGGNRGNHYNSDLAAIQAKISEIEANGDTAVFSGIFWMQGEADVTGADASYISYYEGRFVDLLEFYQQDLDLSDLPNFTVGVIDLNPNPLYDDYAQTMAYREDVEELRSVLFELGMMPNGSAVDTRGYNRVDAWHITNGDQIALGQAMSNEFIGNFGVPEPSSFLFSITGLGLLFRRERKA